MNNRQESQGQERISQPKSIEKHSLKNTSMNVKTKPGLNIKQNDRSKLKHKETKQRYKETVNKKGSKGSKNDRKGTASASRHTTDAFASRRGKNKYVNDLDSHTKTSKHTEHKSTRRSITRDNGRQTNEVTQRNMADIFKGKYFV